MQHPAYDLGACRARIPILRTKIPMNNCSQAPQTDVTRDAAERYLESWNTVGMDWESWMAEVDAARAAFARLINASPADIAVTSSVSEATSSLASALDFTGTRRRIVATEAEFPTVGHVWLAQRPRGAEVEWVPVRDGIIEPAAYDRVLTDRTLLLSACHAYYQNGFKQDLALLAEKAHAAGAWLYVDAYQSLGVHPVDVRALDIDFLASGCLKYLMGVPGIAFLYVRPELAERLEPAVTGWFGREDPFSFRADVLTWASGARRFDTGTPPVLNAYIARAGIELLQSFGIDAIRSWTDELSRRLVEGGARRGLRLHGTHDVASKTPLTAFVCPGDSQDAERRMRERGIVASSRGTVVRLAPHFYSSVDDVETSLDALKEVYAELEHGDVLGAQSGGVQSTTT
jgi:selenocysteine lyase/cysteine desulfurase